MVHFSPAHVISDEGYGETVYGVPGQGLPHLKHG